MKLTLPCLFALVSLLVCGVFARTDGVLPPQNIFVTNNLSPTSLGSGIYLGVSRRGTLAANAVPLPGAYPFPANTNSAPQAVGLMMITGAARQVGDIIISNEVEQRMVLATVDGSVSAVNSPSQQNGFNDPDNIITEQVTDKIVNFAGQTLSGVFGTTLRISKIWNCDILKTDGCLLTVSVYNSGTTTTAPLTYTESVDPDIDAYTSGFAPALCTTDNSVQRRISLNGNGAIFSTATSFGRVAVNSNVFVQFLTFDTRINPGVTSTTLVPAVNEIYTNTLTASVTGDLSMGIGGLLGALKPGQQAQFTAVLGSKDQRPAPATLTCDLTLLPQDNEITCVGSGLTYDYEPDLLAFIKRDGDATGKACASTMIINDYSEIKRNFILSSSPFPADSFSADDLSTSSFYYAPSATFDYATYAIPAKFFGVTATLSFGFASILTGTNTATFCYGPAADFATYSCANGVSVTYSVTSSSSPITYCFAKGGATVCGTYANTIARVTGSRDTFIRISIAKNGLFADTTFQGNQGNTLFLSGADWTGLDSTWVFGAIATATVEDSTTIIRKLTANYIGVVRERAMSRVVGFSMLYPSPNAGEFTAGPAHTATFRIVRSANPTISCPSGTLTRNTDVSLAPLCGVQTLTYPTPTASDACFDNLPVYLVSGPAQGVSWTIPSVDKGMPHSEAAVWAVDGTGVTKAATCNVDLQMVDVDAPIFSKLSGKCVRNIPIKAGFCGTNVEFTFQPNDLCDPSPDVNYGSYVPGTFFPAISVNSFLVTVTDDSGNPGTCDTEVIIDPVPITNLDCGVYGTKDTDPGKCYYTLTHVAPLIDDNPCTITYSPAPGTTTQVPLGNNIPITYVVSSNGTSTTSTCDTPITVRDREKPSLTCSDVSVNTDTNLCTAVVNYTPPVPTDNCPSPTATRTVGSAPGSAFPKGTTLITYRPTDAKSNVGTDCSFNIIVSDKQNPTMTSPATVSVNTDPGVCDAVVTYSISSSDNCDTPTVTNNAPSLVSGSTIGKGTHSITYTATDSSGNSGTSTTSIVVTDNQDPTVISKPSPKDFFVDSTCKYTYVTGDFGSCTASDNCPGSTCSGATIPANGASLGPGTRTITWTATDTAGRTATASTAFRILDNTKPSIPCAPVSLTASAPTCSATTSFGTNTVSDNCPGSTVAFTLGGSPVPGSLSVGVHTIQADATDVAGNTYSCSFDITVAEAAVAITCPTSPVTHQVGAGCKTTISTVPDATIAGCASNTQSNNFVAGDYGLGTFNVVYQIVGNPSKTCTVVHNVVDTNKPSLTCDAAVPGTTDTGFCTKAYSFPSNIDSSISDACPTTSVVTTSPGPSPYGVGAHTQTWTVTDSSGNSKTCSIVLTVTDGQNPTITCPADANVLSDAGSCGAVITGTATPADNCGIATTVRSPPAGALTPPGSGSFTWTTTDTSGKTDTCTQSYTIALPAISITCPTGAAKYTGTGCTASIGSPTVSHPCANTVSPSSTSPFAIGAHTQSYTATSTYGTSPSNQATCSYSFEVFDNNAPTFIPCPATVTLLASPGVCTSTVTPTTPTVTDTCTSASATLNANLVANGNFDKDCAVFLQDRVVTNAQSWAAGTRAVSPDDLYGVTSPSGNCVSDITTDGGNILVTFPSTISTSYDISAKVLCLSASGCVVEFKTTLAGPTLSILTVSNTPPFTTVTGSITSTGTTTSFYIVSDKKALVDNVSAVLPTVPRVYAKDEIVTWIAYDSYGNYAQCSSTVVINDLQNPTATCPSSTSINTSANLCTGSYSYITFPTADNCGTANITPTGSTTLPKGANSVTYTITDAASNSITCPITVTVNDNQNPNIASCPATTTANAEPGTCSGKFYVIPSDNCAVSTITATVDTFSATVSNGGASGYYVTTTSGKTIAWTVTDTSSNTYSSCSQVTSVTDNQDPIIAGCPSSSRALTLNPTTCSAPVDYSGISAGDNCGTPTPVYTPALGASLTAASTPATVVYTDGAGRSATCSFAFTIAAPTFTVTCPNPTRTANVASSGCTYAFQPDTVTVTSTCATTTTIKEGATTLNTNDPLSKGDHTIVYTVTVNGSPTSTQTCTVVLTVSDNTPPSITCPANTPVTASATCSGALPAPAPLALSDNCGTPTVTRDIDSYSSKGPLIVTYTTTDGSGNMATCTTTFTVSDATAPTIDDCSSVFAPSYNTGTLSCSAMIPFTNPTARDNCDASAPATTTSTSPFPRGSNTVTFSKMDSSGNTATTCSDSFIVVDNVPPAITGCPSPTRDLNVDPTTCLATVDYSGIGATDNCDTPTPVYTPALATTLSPGNTPATVVYSDNVPNTATCSFTFHVIPPTLTVTCPNPTRTANVASSGCTYAFQPDTVTITSTCATTTTIKEGATTLNTNDPLSKGDHTIVYTVTVNGSPTSTQTCTVVLTVSDNTPPSITCPANTPVTASATCSGALPAPAPLALSDNCGTPTVTRDIDSYSSKGPLIVTYTATDGSGNMATCTTTFTVSDVTAPTIDDCSSVFAPSYNTDTNACSAMIPFTNPTARDNCDASAPATTTSTSPFPRGSNTVTFSKMDSSGNTATTCSDSFTVVDAQKPTITCPPSATYIIDGCSRVTTYDVVTTSDNCPSNGSPTLSSGLSSGSAFPVGVNTVIWSVTDNSGNTQTCSFTITINDVTPPTFTSCPAVPLNFNSANNNCASLVTYAPPAAFDSCGPSSVMFVSGILPNTIAAVGSYPTVWTASDSSGNTATCAFTINIIDLSPPLITCPSNINAFVDADVCGAIVNYPSATATDDCGTPTLTRILGPASGALFPVATTNIQIQAYDGRNTQICSYTVTVVDNINPTIVCNQPAPSGSDVGVCGAVVNFSPAVGSDNCPNTVTLTSGLAPGSVFPVGRSSTVYTVTDVSGNYASCSTFTEVADDDVPLISCKPVAVTLDATNNFRKVLVESDVVTSKSDNCAIFSTSLSLTVVDFFTTRPTTTTTATVIDRYGLRNTCTSTVTINIGKVIDIGTPVKKIYQAFTITWYNYLVFASTSKVTIRIYDTPVYNAADTILTTVANSINYVSGSIRSYNYVGFSGYPCNRTYYVRLFIKDGAKAIVYVGDQSFFLSC